MQSRTILEIFPRIRLGREQCREWGKKGLARAFHWLGANYLRMLADSNQLIMLTYHRVLPAPEAVAHPLAWMVMPEDLFELQIAHIASNYSPLSFPDAIRLLQSGRLPRRAIVITFDDGYRDNYDYAWPVLRRYGMPAVFFVATGAVEQRSGFWWDRAAGHIDKILRCRMHESLPDTNGLSRWVLDLLENERIPSERSGAVREIVTRIGSSAPDERNRILEALRSIAGSGECMQDLVLSWDQIREFVDSGMTVGSHTVSHPFLDELENKDAWREIRDSVEHLKERLNLPVRFFSYPSGRFGRDTANLLDRAGIEAAVTTLPGKNHAGTDRYKLSRFDAGYCWLRSGFDPAVLDMELQGWLNPFRSQSAANP